MKKIEWIMGLDEVGRGPLAGPVVAAAALIELNRPMSEEAGLSESLWLQRFGVTDSKKCPAKKRQSILEELNLLIEPEHHGYKQNLNARHANISRLSLAIGQCSEVEIDQLNILHASMEAMKRAMILCLEYANLDATTGLVLVDGNRLPSGITSSARAIIKGDLHQPLIGLASIGAKVYRDLLMKKLDQYYPDYGLAKHAGYPTPYHLHALSIHGVSPCHRKSFKPVRVYLDQ